MLLVKCCYCQKIIGLKRSQKLFGGVSHGVCKKCLKIQMDILKNRTGRIVCKNSKLG